MTQAQSYLDKLRSTMEPLSDSIATFKGMIYGVSGVGKTVMAVQIAQEITAPDKKILYIDTAEGWVSLKNHPELKERTERMRYGNLGQLEALCHAIRTNEPPFNEFGTIILDEASSSADSALDDVLKDRAASKRGDDPDTPTQPDYNTATNRVRKAYMGLLTLPGVHVILISHTRKDKDARNVEVQQASFLPKLGQKIKQPLHFIGNLSGNEIPASENRPARYTRILQVHPTRTIDAKTRIGGLEPQVEYPEFIIKLKKWLGGEIPTVKTTMLVKDFDPEVPVTIEGE